MQRHTFDAGFGSLHVVESRYDAHSSQDEHVHAHDSVALVVSGRVLERVGGHERSLGPGSVLIKPRGTPHTDLYLDATTRVLAVRADGASRRTRGELAAIAHSYRVVRADAVTRAWVAWRTSVFDGAPSARVARDLRRLLANLSTIADTMTTPSWLDSIARRIEREHELTTRQIALDLGMHPVALARAFSRRFGIAPMAYARRIRIERAIAAVGAGARSVDAACASGFADQPHFTRAFRAAFGTTPAAYLAAIAD
ncbi:MAG: helix-turn-helix domain-containing protein [Planctomycetes bacterium]|nr:helix-turn-helix domain-containing protein [Planctomycetota bacterium]MCC7168882.1 helix-turn-helix domain-containing protein [Planctomycetota bacterium]